MKNNTTTPPPQQQAPLLDVLFVSMPYASVERPSIALSTLAAGLQQASIGVRTLYGNLLFAERIGLMDYEGVNNSDITSQIGEWTFSEAAFRATPRDVSEFAGVLIAQGHPGAGLTEALLRIRASASAFVEEMAARVVEARPRIAGCSSVFQQHCASLALLRRVRELDPGIVTMLGGPNCEAAMGRVTHEQFRWVDFVVSGEADHLLPDLCRLIFAHGRNVPLGQLPAGVMGPATRASAGIAPASAAPHRAVIDNLDDLPMPDFDDYFQQLAASPLRRSIMPGLPVETSRGCWWGAKHHCTFCGLNGDGMAFRAKSEERAEAEVRWLSGRYGLTKIMTVDNILDNRYFGKLLPAMAADGDFRFFYETKSNLSRDQVRMLSQAGVRWIQPGIEALHDGLLALIRKGCGVTTNVQLLKWARTYGVWVIWNHLYGAPGDRPEWYEEIAGWLPLIIHLQPPTTGGMTRIRYDRFSPYFKNPESFGLTLEPYWAYRHVYPLSERGLMDQAYFFSQTGPAGPAPLKLIQLMQEWTAAFYGERSAGNPLPRRGENAPDLSLHRVGTKLFVHDTRPCAVDRHYELSDIEAAVCHSLDTARGVRGLVDEVRRARPAETAAAPIEGALGRLIDRKIAAGFGDKFLCLATGEEAIPYLGFEEFAGGLALLAGQRAPLPPADPWETSIHDVFELVTGAPHATAMGERP